MPSAAPQSVLPRSLLSEVFKDPRTLLAFERALQAALVVNPSGIAVALNAPNFVGEFDGVGDGATNNDPQFTAAEASTFAEIYLPDGEFVSTLPQSAFQKHYIGPGKIVLTGVATMPGRFTYIANRPALWPTQGNTGFFRGNTNAVDPEWHVIGPGTREYLTARYFEAGFIPHPVWHEVKSGGSGWLTTAAGALAIGDVSAVLISADGLTVGDVVGLTPAGMDGAITDTITIDTIVGATITFHPALTTAYPNIDPPPLNPAPGRATLMKGHRTWGGTYYSKITGSAPGDIYGALWRMNQNYVMKAGQTHFFEGSTVGGAGVEINFGPGSGGTFGTGFENIFIDAGEDVAVMDHVASFNRGNDTGARSVVWFGINFQSSGAKPIDVAFLAQGKYRTILDTVRADLTYFTTPGDNINAAINTALGHRWVMNSTANAGGRGGSALWGTQWGNTPGDMFIESGNDGNDFIRLRYNRAAPNDGRLTVRPTVIQVNKVFQGGASIEAAAELVTGGVTPRVILGPGLGCWIERDAATGSIRGTTNNGAAFTVLVI